MGATHFLNCADAEAVLTLPKGKLILRAENVLEDKEVSFTDDDAIGAAELIIADGQVLDDHPTQGHVVAYAAKELSFQGAGIPNGLDYYGVEQ